MKAIDLVNGQAWAIARADFESFREWAADADVEPQSLAAFQGKAMDGSESMTIRGGVATIPVRGMIFRHDTPITRFLATVFGGSITEQLSADFNSALANREVRQILLQVDSPGGHAAGIGELAQMIHASSKPVVAYVGSQGASAAYYLASAARSVVADPSAILGSIGVVVGMSKKKPSDPDEIVSSQSPDKRPDPQTEAGKAKIQATVNSMAAVFIADVARFRGTSPEAVMADFGRGGVMVGQEAVDAGMADSIGSYEQVLEMMRAGECPARKTPRPDPKAGKRTKEPAMSEQANPPVAGDQPIMSAAEASDLRTRLAAAEKRAEAEAVAKADATSELINARADAFVSEVVEKATGTQYALGLRDAFVQAATDDHAHPIAGNKTARQDKLRAAVKARPAPTKEVVGADPDDEARALESDPAAEAGSREESALDATARQTAQQLNGRK